jgi:hypothetical protein
LHCQILVHDLWQWLFNEYMLMQCFQEFPIWKGCSAFLFHPSIIYVVIVIHLSLILRSIWTTQVWGSVIIHLGKSHGLHLQNKKFHGLSFSRNTSKLISTGKKLKIASAMISIQFKAQPISFTS